MPTRMAMSTHLLRLLMEWVSSTVWPLMVQGLVGQPPGLMLQGQAHPSVPPNSLCMKPVNAYLQQRSQWVRAEMLLLSASCKELQHAPVRASALHPC